MRKSILLTSSPAVRFNTCQKQTFSTYRGRERSTSVLQCAFLLGTKFRLSALPLGSCKARRILRAGDRSRRANLCGARKKAQEASTTSAVTPSKSFGLHEKLRPGCINSHFSSIKSASLVEALYLNPNQHELRVRFQPRSYLTFGNAERAFDLFCRLSQRELLQNVRLGRCL